ncbi:MAG: magnesium transporter [Rickettsiales bacterium]|nr:magnesium transporter [Rickettsiales bacterium]|tara:strand:- start:1816 stop:3177 length:1362 start_codon:yes stop_codon:yes gene_type:complete
MNKEFNNLDLLKPDIFNNFIDLLEKKESKKIFRKIKDFHPSEIASYIQILNFKHRKQFLEILSQDFESKILVELESSFLKKIINEIDMKIIFKAINDLDSDDATLIIKSLDSERKRLILSKIPIKERKNIEGNLMYDENTAGRLMQAELVSVPLHYDVGDAIDYLRKKRPLPKVFYDLYVIDSNQKFAGTVSLSRIISSSRKEKIKEIMKQNNMSVHSSLDQEDVADIFRKRNLTSIAVIDDKKKLLGTINVEDVVDVIDDEAQEDILKLAGVGDQDFYGAILSVTRARFTWLFFNLIAAFFATYVIRNFEGTIDKLAILAALMPIVASMGGCSGTQSLTTAVRAIAMKQLTWSNALRSMGKEVSVGLINGIIFSGASLAITYFWFSDLILSFVISGSLFLNLIFGSFFGVFTPIFLTKYGVDPAIASGTFVTTLTDVVGFFMFLSLATIFLI